MPGTKFYRLSLDTLYFGLSGDFSFIEKIKKNLFSLCGISIFPLKNGTRFYKTKLSDSNQNACVNILVDKRENNLNDDYQLEFNGHFFRKQTSLIFVDWLFKEFGEYIRFQRIDTCLDICANQHISKLYKFPRMMYRDDYPYRRVDIQTYGRILPDGRNIINMMSVGKKEVKTKIYDKMLDLQEKDGQTYEEIYGIPCLHAWRIETMFRGEKVKNFIHTLREDKVEITVMNICQHMMFYTFQKFWFDGFSAGEVKNYNIIGQHKIRVRKHIQNLYVRKAYHLNKSKKEVNEAIKISDEIKVLEEYEKVVNNFVTENRYKIHSEKTRGKNPSCPSIDTMTLTLEQITESLVSPDIVTYSFKNKNDIKKKTEV